MASPIRILIVDDHPVVRAGVRALLADADDFELVGEVEDGHRAVEEAHRHAPDVILMDLLLPGIDGVEACRRILDDRPETAIVAMTSADLDAEVLAAIEAGAVGYLAKTSPGKDFFDAVRRVACGAAWLPAALTRRLLGHLSSRPELATVDPLTVREQEVLEQLAGGSSNRQIASDLGIAEVTVRTHVSHILGKLGASNRVEAALYALRSGLVALPSPER